ncbi:uncharacterized protein LOC131177584 [Hevea brasiliensis]|uniref:uncharacterized protein LOC131177584 n=1 Tax=Hevea brasiliensis TaxID=3981 RepID=UPI0025D5FFA2|nr:uncharacterized protein LOC131177584 [Hevea brasiliensis]
MLKIIIRPIFLLSFMLRARYYPQKPFVKPSVGYQPSFAWRSIIQARWIIQKCSRWLIGNGGNVLIWKNNWLPYQNGFRFGLPPRYLDIGVKIYEAWKRLSLAFPSVGNVFVSETCLNSSSASSSTYGYDSPIWKMIWHQEIPPKVNHLMFKACTDQFHVSSAQCRQGILVDNVCSYYNAGIEIMIHVMRYCSFSKEVWGNSPICLPVLVTNLSMADWILQLVAVLWQDQMEIVFMLVWALWYSRNCRSTQW